MVVAGGGVWLPHVAALLSCFCRYISLVIVQSDVFAQDHHSLTYTNGELPISIAAVVLLIPRRAFEAQPAFSIARDLSGAELCQA